MKTFLEHLRRIYILISVLCIPGVFIYLGMLQERFNTAIDCRAAIKIEVDACNSEWNQVLNECRDVNKDAIDLLKKQL